MQASPHPAGTSRERLHSLAGAPAAQAWGQVTSCGFHHVSPCFKNRAQRQACKYPAPGHILNHTLKCSSEQTLPLSYMCSQDVAYEVF